VRGTIYLFFFFEQAKMQYIISPRVFHLAQGVQKRNTPKMYNTVTKISC
jgi:hypothetical protein